MLLNRNLNQRMLKNPLKKTQVNAESCYKRLLPHTSAQADTVLGPIRTD